MGVLRGRKKLKQVGRSGAWRHEILRMAEAANASDVDDQPFWNEVHVGRSRHVFLFSPLVNTSSYHFLLYDVLTLELVFRTYRRPE